VQRDQIEKYAALKGYEVTEWIEDLDQSGAKAGRPGFQRALQLVEEKVVDGVACAKLDRFARSVIDGREGLERINAAGGTLVLVAEGLDTNTPMGKAMFTILLAFAELELDRIRENFDIARERAIARGVHVGAKIKIGYLKTPGGQLEPDPATAHHVKRIFQMRAEDASWQTICAYLDEALGGGWTIQTVMGIVSSRVYLGEVRHGDHVNPAAHPALVTRAEWQAAQQTAGLRAPRRVGSLLAGIVRCAACGYAMTRATSGRRFGDIVYWRYECRKVHGGGRCPAPTSIAGPALDDHVERAYLDRREADRLVAAADPIEIPDTALAQLEAAEAELAAYRDAQLISVIGADTYRAGLQERVRVVEDAARAVAVARRAHPAQMPPADLLDLWPQLHMQERRRILAAAIDTVYVKRSHLGRRGTPVADRARILWAGEGPDVLPGRGTSQLAPFDF
jgi:site-specific DNA recombinase